MLGSMLQLFQPFWAVLFSDTPWYFPLRWFHSFRWTMIQVCTSILMRFPGLGSELLGFFCYYIYHTPNSSDLTTAGIFMCVLNQKIRLWFYFICYIVFFCDWSYSRRGDHHGNKWLVWKKTQHHVICNSLDGGVSHDGGGKGKVVALLGQISHRRLCWHNIQLCSCGYISGHVRSCLTFLYVSIQNTCHVIRRDRAATWVTLLNLCITRKSLDILKNIKGHNVEGYKGVKTYATPCSLLNGIMKQWGDWACALGWFYQR